MKRLRPGLAALLACAFTAAWAHGDGAATGAHAAPPAPAQREQKAWGIAGDARRAARTVEIRMGDDMRFSPDRIEVRQGETVRLVVRNHGQLLHELVIGSREALHAHAELMRKHPGMQHDEPDMAHVGPARSGEIVWTFNRPGDFQFACLIAGHYQAGMVGNIRVRPASKKGTTS